MKYIITIIATASMLIGAPKREQATEKPTIERPAPKPHFPRHWGKPPAIQTRDMVKLPGKFGMGSSTLAKWIADNIKKDKKPGVVNPKPKPKPPVEPISPIVPVPPAEVKTKIDLYRMGQKRMQDGLKARISELGKNPSREEVREAVEDYKKDNKQLIEWQKELGKDIQDWHKDNKPRRESRPEPSIDVKEKIAIVIAKEKEMNKIRSTFRETLKEAKDMPKEKREELIKNFKEANAEKHQALKEAQKELQKKIRETKQEGARRE